MDVVTSAPSLLLYKNYPPSQLRESGQRCLFGKWELYIRSFLIIILLFYTVFSVFVVYLTNDPQGVAYTTLQGGIIY